MAFMARRPPSLIALGDTELQTLLQPNFLQPLVLKFNSLRLNDLDGPSHSAADGHDDAGDGTSINSHNETFTTLSSSTEVSSGAKIASAQEFGGSLLTLAHSIPSFLASGMTELANQASDRSNPSSSSNTTANQNLPCLSSQNQHFSSLNNTSRGVAFVAAPPDCPPISLSQRCKATTSQKGSLVRFPMSGFLDINHCFIQRIIGMLTDTPCKIFQI